mmetsp:Transcript_37619/g.108169  ORF Transcript_37619/g.108169 Transcript_37619/m.108169 type:complete len:232 (-) Transcript_37619:7-702(-)
MEGAAVGAPNAARLQRCDRRSPWAIVQQRKASERFPGGQGVHDLAIHAHLQCPLLHDEEGGAHLALLDHHVALRELVVLHGAQNRIELTLLQQRADPVLLHAQLDQLHCAITHLSLATALHQILLLALIVHSSPGANSFACAAALGGSGLVLQRRRVGQSHPLAAFSVGGLPVLLALSPLLLGDKRRHLLTAATPRRAHGWETPRRRRVSPTTKALSRMHRELAAGGRVAA